MLFKETELVCTKHLYNELWTRHLQLSLFEVLDTLKRRRTKRKNHINKRPKALKGAALRSDQMRCQGIGEVNTVVGLRMGKETVVFTQVEKLGTTVFPTALSV